MQPFPGKITRIEAQSKVRRHLGQRANVFIDDKFSFALDVNLVLERGLRSGTVLSATDLNELLRKDGDARAFARALHYLSYRPRSREEVRARLKRDEWPDEVIVRVLARLEEKQLTNDSDFAAQWIDHRTLSSRPRGAYLLRQELRHKGVDRETIEAALPDADAEIEHAVAAARPKLRQFPDLKDRAQRDKMIAFLQRRGFSFSTIKAALQVLQDEESEES